MKNEFVLCVRYNARIVLENNRLQAFEMHFSNCSECGEKVILSGETHRLLESNPNLKPLCQICCPDKIALHGQPRLTMTTGQLKESASLLQKLKAKNN